MTLTSACPGYFAVTIPPSDTAAISGCAETYRNVTWSLALLVGVMVNVPSTTIVQLPPSTLVDSVCVAFAISKVFSTIPV